jgi:hypothetical protein
MKTDANKNTAKYGNKSKPLLAEVISREQIFGINR